MEARRNVVLVALAVASGFGCEGLVTRSSEVVSTIVDAGAGDVGPHGLLCVGQPALLEGQYPNATSNLVIHGNQIYWTELGSNNGATGSVHMSTIDGSSPTTIATGQSLPLALAVNSTGTFWAESVTAGVYFVPTSGGAPQNLFPDSNIGADGSFTIDEKSVYWADADGVEMSPVTGTANGEPKTLLWKGAAFGLTTDSSGVYFRSPTNIWRVQSGSPAVALAPVTGAGGPPVLDDQFVYWATLSDADATNGSIARVSKSGGDVQLLTQNQPWGESMVVDDTYLYFSEGVQFKDDFMVYGSINRIPKGGGSIEVLASCLDGAPDLAIDSAHIYSSGYGIFTLPK